MYVETDKEKKRYTFSIHERALEMVKEGYRGEGMNGDDAFDEILLAAANPDIERDMSEGKFRFWHVLDRQFQLIKARAKLGIEASEKKPATESDKEKEAVF